MIELNYINCFLLLLLIYCILKKNNVIDKFTIMEYLIADKQNNDNEEKNEKNILKTCFPSYKRVGNWSFGTSPLIMAPYDFN